MPSRRQFLQTSALGLGSLMLPNSLFSKNISPYEMGLQLYTVRDQLQKNPKATLQAVASIGYKKVELYDYNDGFFGMTTKEFGALLRSFRLRAPSGHYKLGKHDVDIVGTIRRDWRKAIDDAKFLGHEYMTLAYLHESERESLDDYKRLAEWLNMAGQMCQNAGIQLCYHNHAFEFEEMNGEIPYDILLSFTEPELLKFEMDLYWVYKAGRSPFQYFSKYPGRFPLWHVKDMDSTKRKHFTAVGRGTIEFPPIFEKADRAGMKHFFVEQDECPGNPLDSIKVSYDYLMEMEY